MFKRQKLCSNCGMPGCIRLLIGLKPSRAIPDVVRDMKADRPTGPFVNLEFSLRFKLETLPAPF